MEPPSAPNLFKFLANPHEALVDQTSVGLDLGFTRATQEAEAATLAFKVSPGPNQPRSLILQMREFDLERPLLRRRAFTKDIQDQASAVDHLAAPGAFQIALLDRRQGGIDYHHLYLVQGYSLPLVFDLAFTEQD